MKSVRVLTNVIAALTLISFIGCVQIFLAFIHKQISPDIACSEKIRSSVPLELLEDYDRECNLVMSNVQVSMNTALDYGVLIALASFFILVCAIIIYYMDKSSGKTA